MGAADNLSTFHGGPEGIRDKLNSIVEAVNVLKRIRGDDQFVSVNHTPGGLTIKVNVDAIVARVPRVVTANYNPPLVAISSTASGPGKYYGNKVLGYYGSDISASTPVSLSEFVAAYSSDTCLILNLREEGGTGHKLDPTGSGNPPKLYAATLVQIQSDGTEVYTIDGDQNGIDGDSERWGQVHWDGTTLTQDSNSITYVNGRLTDVGDTESTTIDTTEDCES